MYSSNSLRFTNFRVPTYKTKGQFGCFNMESILLIVIRTPAYRQHHPPLDSFHVWSENHSYDCSLPTSPRSITFLERDVCDVSLPCGVLGRRFGALLPHFTNRNISSPKFRTHCPSTLCVSFSLTNVSHDCRFHIPLRD